MSPRPEHGIERVPAVSAGVFAAPLHGAISNMEFRSMSMAMLMPGPIAEARDGVRAGHHGE